MPTVLAIKNGDVVDKFVGIKDEDQLEAFLKKLKKNTGKNGLSGEGFRLRDFAESAKASQGDMKASSGLQPWPVLDGRGFFPQCDRNVTVLCVSVSPPPNSLLKTCPAQGPTRSWSLARASHWFPVTRNRNGNAPI